MAPTLASAPGWGGRAVLLGLITALACSAPAEEPAPAAGAGPGAGAGAAGEPAASAEGGARADRPATPARARISASEAVAWPALPHDRRIAWGPAPEQFGELRLPAAPGPHPVAVVLHGGCWLSIADNDYMDRLAAALTDAGWATWNLEFRTADHPGGGWPGMLRDVGRGVDHLRTVARDHPLDLARVVTVGHSSGGHLALWVAARPRIAPAAELAAAAPLPVAGAVGLAAVGDLAAFDARRERACGTAIHTLLGGTPADVPERLGQASPAELLPLGVPQLLLTGVDDRAVPPSSVDDYVRRARAAGEQVRHERIPGAGHFEVVAPATPAGAGTLRLIVAFLEDATR